MIPEHQFVDTRPGAHLLLEWQHAAALRFTFSVTLEPGRTVMSQVRALIGTGTTH